MCLNPGKSRTDGAALATDGISATPFDLRQGNFTYQSGAGSGLNPSTPSALDANNMFAAGVDMWGPPGQDMWYLPTGPTFFQNMDANTTVAMTAEGVNVGGIDLLDYMAMGDYPMEGGGYGG